MQLFPPEIIENTTESHLATISTSTKIIYLLVLLTVVLVLALTPFIKIDITIQSRGIIRSKNNNNFIQSAVYGEIEEINIENDQIVNKGDTLLVLKAKKQNEKIKFIDISIKENRLYISDINSILRYNSNYIQTSKYNGEYKSYLTQLKEQKLQTLFFEQQNIIAKRLLAKHIYSENEYMEVKKNYETSVTREQVIHDQFHSRLLTEKAKIEFQNLELLSNKKQLLKELEMYVLTAPTAGTIIHHQGAQIGNFISPSQTIAEISPSSDLIVECFINPKDIGYFKEGMDVNFQFDAFNYNQWGMARGKVISISDDIISINDKQVFRAECQLEQQVLTLKNGYCGMLKKGMTLTGRFFITKRTLFQLIFDKVDSWLNPKLVLN